MNLLTSPWIPVRTLSGVHRLISPLQLYEPDDPPVELNATRADFNGALAQFLIALQQLITPEDAASWRKVLNCRSAPDIDQLRGYAAHFELDNGPRRFMQDMDFADAQSGDLSGLLLEAPGGNTVKNNADLFIKRCESMALSLPLAAQALLTLQMNAPAGGQGHRTSIRGGGPVSMLLWPESLDGQPALLWQKAWLNTLVFKGDQPRPEIVFPWSAPCLTSEKDKDVRTQLHAKSPSERELAVLCYFATPRRIRVHWEDEQICAFTGDTGPSATTYQTRNFGANYKSEQFRHPLSPYYRDKSGAYLPVHLADIGFTYADWITITDSDRANAALRPPAVFDRARLGESLNLELKDEVVWAFGFLMDNMKCLSWNEARFPRLAFSHDEQRDRVLFEAKSWIAGTEFTRKSLDRQLRAAWTHDGKKGDTSTAQRELYAMTESAFYAAIQKCIALAGDDSSLAAQHQDLRREWHKTLVKTALTLFARHAEAGDVADKNVQAIARAATAHKFLILSLGRELKDILALDVIERAEKAAKRRKAA